MLSVNSTIPLLREALPKVGIIALTLLNTDGYRQAALAAGANDFVAKGNMNTELLPAIRKLAEAHGNMEETEQDQNSM